MNVLMYSTEDHYCTKKFLILINVKNKIVDFFYSEEIELLAAIIGRNKW